MRIGVDVGGTNTDAVLMDGRDVVAWTKQPTSPDVARGVAAAVAAVLADGKTDGGAVQALMIGTTHFTNALVERVRLDRVGILRLASPSGEALPPMTGWPGELVDRVGGPIHLLPGGYEVDGREIAPFDEARVRAAAADLFRQGFKAFAITSAFAPLDARMEERAAAIIREVAPDAHISQSHQVGRLGLVERENAAILNAALSGLARQVVDAFGQAAEAIGITAPLYISQNDGTLISAERAAAYPVLTIGSGPTNSMRGAAFLTGITDAIVLDVGGTTTDIGVLVGGFPRESAVSVDIGGVRTNFRMPDTLALGLGGGTRIHQGDALRIGPDSAGYRIGSEAFLFGGDTLTASDVAVAAGRAQFGDVARVASLAPAMIAVIMGQIDRMVEDGIDRMKTARGDATVIAVGGGAFLVPDAVRGAARVIRPPHAGVANAVGAAIAQVGAVVEQIVDYQIEPRDAALDRLRQVAVTRIVAGGGIEESAEIVEIEENALGYLPGRAMQVRIRAAGDLMPSPEAIKDRKPSYA
ncbi:N-methylhydantoinase A/oxoprolinase/acetone carboxylase beta subunit [Sphingomonas zeicaulis]|uniref:hydantoinase/oxoprolinase N-terminal domain-containing protein n=1 Tax=Sphingomonas zeicaulis TaxID=1632740 RepID=UPI003D1C41CE